MSEAEIECIPYQYKRKVLRYVCPSPQTILAALIPTVAFFSLLVDPEKNRRFFLKASVVQPEIRLRVHDIQCGMLSDNPSYSVYIKTGSLSFERCRYRCTRDTSGLEGSHQGLRVFMDPRSLSCGPLWFETIAGRFEFCWNVRAGRASACQMCFIK